MIKACTITVCLYFLTTALIMGMGLAVSFPWALILGLGIIPIRFACAVGIGGFQLQKHLLSSPWILRLSGITLGLLLVAVYRFDTPIFLAVWVASVGLTVGYFVKSGFTV